MSDFYSYDKSNVRIEDTSWRDEAISKRHRIWGFDCPATDIDFLMIEYSFKKPVMLVDYKNHRDRSIDISRANYQASAELASGYGKHGIPFIVAFYNTKNWSFTIRTVNDQSKKFFTDGEVLTEKEYVYKLYSMRNNTIKEEIAGKLFNTKE